MVVIQDIAGALQMGSLSYMRIFYMLELQTAELYSAWHVPF
jgi:hypothetical protein